MKKRKDSKLGLVRFLWPGNMEVRDINSNIMKKIWFITGVSSGIGKILTETVIETGDFVIGTFRKQEQVDSFNKNNKGKGIAVLMDVQDEESVQNGVSMILKSFPKIDVLVNNAGIGFVGAVEEASIAEVSKIMDVNILGTLRVLKAVLPTMRAQKSGHIIQMSSHAGVKSFAGFGIYNASKFALEGYSEAMADELRPLGINVTLVELSPFRTKFAGSSLHEVVQEIEDYAATASKFRAILKERNGSQEGDPYKASLAIIDQVNTETPTLRLPLGKMALKTIEMKLNSVRCDIEIHRETAERVVYETS